ncbi:hypothetical protein [Hymenobacter fastidiosus]|uniref:hypothetical protein n=1 Tax=Hymenobacter fastidiosus TaxID=486264 RepID=UPI0031F0F90F
MDAPFAHNGHILRLPGPPPKTLAAAVATQALPKSVPLLVLADYLSGHQREALGTMRRGGHTGRPYRASGGKRGLRPGHRAAYRLVVQPEPGAGIAGDLIFYLQQHCI